MANVPFSKLKGRITERFGSTQNLAESCGISLCKLYPSLAGKRQFRFDEVVRLCASDCLDIPPERIHEYFFCELSSILSNTNNQTSPARIRLKETVREE